jgi:hypothetical protein
MTRKARCCVQVRRNLVLAVLIFSQVTLAQAQVTKVRMPDLTERLARVTGAGRMTEKKRDPDGYKKLEEDVEKAVRRGAEWLKNQFEFAADSLNTHNAHLTFGVLALVHAGEFKRDAALAQRCTDYLLERPLNSNVGTYAAAVTAMALAERLGQKTDDARADLNAVRYRRRILECAQWLVENQGWGEDRKVWGYGDNVDEKKLSRVLKALEEKRSLEVVRHGDLVEAATPNWDNSVSQFAVLGLRSAAQAGVKLPRVVWERVEKHFLEVQDKEDKVGGWGYGGIGGVTGGRTCGGVASLLIAREQLGRDRSTPDEAVVKGLEWLAGRFDIEKNPEADYAGFDHYHFYLYALERVGAVANTEFLGDHEWYPLGARHLLAQQSKDGFWLAKHGDSHLDTCCAILFLRRATELKPSWLRVTYGKSGLAPALMPAVELVLDSSNSMAEKVDGEEKSRIARRVMDKVLAELPDQFQVGLRVFGHVGFWDWRKKGEPADNDPRWNTDSELMVPIGPLSDNNHRKRIKERIDFVEPKGNTPLVYSLLQARKDFPDSWKGPKAVVLVSDGMENCGGKLEDVAKAYKTGDVDVVINVVGFAVPAKERKELEAIAKMGKGTYYHAASAKELAAALAQAVKIGYVVLDEKGQKEVAKGFVNGAPVSLPAGTYQVQLQGIKSAPRSVRIEAGQTQELVWDTEGKFDTDRREGRKRN